ncbi:Uncharacterised protein [Mycobacteroides abscessus subsp. abscessus]|nr:Uncharacterised protein [Mycobacteroides abscessus subsp. abscessus]
MGVLGLTRLRLPVLRRLPVLGLAGLPVLGLLAVRHWLPVLGLAILPWLSVLGLAGLPVLGLLAVRRRLSILGLARLPVLRWLTILRRLRRALPLLIGLVRLAPGGRLVTGVVGIVRMTHASLSRSSRRWCTGVQCRTVTVSRRDARLPRRRRRPICEVKVTPANRTRRSGGRRLPITSNRPRTPATSTEFGSDNAASDRSDRCACRTGERSVVAYTEADLFQQINDLPVPSNEVAG